MFYNHLTFLLIVFILLFFFTVLDEGEQLSEALEHAAEVHHA